MATGGTYVHKLHGKTFGGISNILVLCNFLKILKVSDKMIHKAFRTHTKPIRENFHFHYLPKLYIGFKNNVLGTWYTHRRQLSEADHIWYSNYLSYTEHQKKLITSSEQHSLKSKILLKH